MPPHGGISLSLGENSHNYNLLLIEKFDLSIFYQIGSLTLDHFILKHEKYINPEEFVLNNDFVTLMAISETKVWFSVSSKINVYGLEKFPFAFMAHFFCSEKLLILDHNSLHKIAGKCMGPSANCILINNTGRCGSTLLNQVSFFANTGCGHKTKYAK